MSLIGCVSNFVCRAAYEAKAGSRVRRSVLHRVIREASDVKVRWPR